MQTSSAHVLAGLSTGFSFAPRIKPAVQSDCIAHAQRKLGSTPANPNLFVDAFEIRLHVQESKAHKTQDISWQLLRAEHTRLSHLNKKHVISKKCLGSMALTPIVNLALGKHGMC